MILTKQFVVIVSHCKSHIYTPWPIRIYVAVYFWITNWSHIATHLVVGATLFKNPQALSFQIGSGRNLAGYCFSGKCTPIDGVGFLMTSHIWDGGITPFHAEECCYLVSAHAAYARRPLHPPPAAYAAASAGYPLAILSTVLRPISTCFV